jgi:hypothetical protein
MEFALNDKYPIETTEQLIKAAEYVDKNLSRFHPDDRVKIASKLDSRSNHLKVNLNQGWITNYTRMQKSAQLSPDFESAMEMRKQACLRHKISLTPIDGLEKTPEPVAIIDEIVKVSSTMNSKELLDTIVEFDKRAAIEYLYDQQIIDPYITVFGSLSNPEFDAVKLAGEATQYDLVRGSRDQEKLASVKETFGEDFASNFRKNPILSLEGMKGPEKELLSTLMG